MRRRTVLRGGGSLVGASALTGCVSGLFETRSARVSPLPEHRPDAVYYPSHVEGMTMAGRGSSGDYVFGLMYSFAHRFWNVNGERVEKTSIEDDDSAHLMTTVWDPETGIVIPGMGLPGRLTRGKTVFEGPLQRTLDPDLHYQRGRRGRPVGRRPDALGRDAPLYGPPRGYETAFGGLLGGLPDVTIQLQ